MGLDSPEATAATVPLNGEPHSSLPCREWALDTLLAPLAMLSLGTAFAATLRKNSPFSLLLTQKPEQMRLARRAQSYVRALAAGEDWEKRAS